MFLLLGRVLNVFLLVIFGVLVERKGVYSLIHKFGIVASIVKISLVNLIFGLWLILRKNLLL